MTMNVNLTSPGEKYAFTVDLTNNGSVPALINTLNITELTEEQKVYLRWKVEYEDESPLEVGDLLKAGETKKVHIYLEYKNLRAKDLYPSAPINLNLSVQANFYLPEETFNTVTITKNGSTKLVQVSNLIQETILDDFPIESTDQVIACNNGVEPSTDTNNKIVLSKVKQDATCRIESSLANAVTNSGTETSNLAILQNATTDTRLTIEANQNITLDMNKKEYTFTTGNNNPQINVSGILTIKDTNQEGNLKTTQNRLLDCLEDSTCIVNNAKLTRNSESGMGCDIRGGGKTTITNSYIYTDYAISIVTQNLGADIIVRNSTIVAEFGKTSLALAAKESTISSYNSILIADKTCTAPNTASADNSKVYLCNNVCNTNNYDIDAVYSNVQFYYSSNNTFKNSTNIPTLNYYNRNNVYQTELACAE